MAHKIPMPPLPKQRKRAPVRNILVLAQKPSVFTQTQDTGNLVTIHSQLNSRIFDTFFSSKIRVLQCHFARFLCKMCT